MTKDVKISITIEIENGQKKRAEFVIQSDHFEQRLMEIQKQIGEMTGKAVLESYDDQIRKEEAKRLKVLGRETRAVMMECIKQKSGWQKPAPASNGSRGTAIGCRTR